MGDAPMESFFPARSADFGQKLHSIIGYWTQPKARAKMIFRLAA
jgi:hypothetical protein